MLKASADTVLPTSIIGSLPRPHWFTENLGRRSFLEAMVDSRYREQYEDVVATYLKSQEIAGIDICTDGDAHYDEQVAGFSWQSYAPNRMAGFSTDTPQPSEYKVGAAAYPRATSCTISWNAACCRASSGPSALGICNMRRCGGPPSG